MCDPYKKSLKRKYDINVEGNPTLDEAESCVAQICIDCGHSKINLTPGSTIKYNKLLGSCYIEASVELNSDAEIKY